MTSKTKKPRAGDMQSYITAGLQLIPLHVWNAVDNKGRDRGKTPRDGAWQARDYDSHEVLEAVISSGINAGVRLPPSIMVLDVDPRNFGTKEDPKNLEGRDRLAELVEAAGIDLSVAPHTVTGSGGHHYWFKKPADVGLLDSLEEFPGIEFKSLGRQVVAAGSVHPNGTHYEWDDFAPFLHEMPDMPPKLLALARRPVRAHGDAAGSGDLTPDMLAESLEHIDPEDFQDHDTWRDLMMACHHATDGEGRQEFIEWSTRDAKYQDDAWIIGRRWDSLSVNPGGGKRGRPVTIKFLHKVVQEAGGEVSRVKAEDDFDVYESEEELGHGVDDKSLREEPQLTGGDKVMEEMNAIHCAVMESGKFRILTEEWDPVLKRKLFTRSSKEDFEHRYITSLVEKGDKLVTKGAYWFRHPDRRFYQGVIFDPEREHSGYLNLWRGWAIQPAEKKDGWSLLKQLVLEVLAQGNKAYYDYIIRWLAYMIQHPSSAAEVALCFRGAKGTGKGTLGRALASIVGAHGLHISSPEHLVGRFNSHLQNCVFLFADEAFWAGDKAGEAKLKQLVTEPTIAYEGKGRDAVMGKNHVHILMAANGDWVVPAGLDGERRFAVFEVSNGRRGDKDFFKALNHQLYREDGLEALLYDLLNYDLGDWAPRDHVPATQALMDQKVMTMSDIERWWYNKLVDGVLPGARGDWRHGKVVVVKDAMRADYLEFAREQRVFRPADSIALGMKLKNLVNGDMVNTQVKVAEDDYTTKVDKHGRASAAKIPSLNECRKIMEAHFGGAITWPKEQYLPPEDSAEADFGDSMFD